jgi:hypothetical protein
MKIAILAALALGAAPAFAQVNLGNSSKDQATSDAQRTKEDSKSTASSSTDPATPQSSDSSATAKSSDSSISAKSSDSSTSIGDSGATADSKASADTKSPGVDQVRKDKKKGVARARAAKRQREKSGAKAVDPRAPDSTSK